MHRRSFQLARCEFFLRNHNAEIDNIETRIGECMIQDLVADRVNIGADNADNKSLLSITVTSHYYDKVSIHNPSTQINIVCRILQSYNTFLSTNSQVHMHCKPQYI